MISHAQADRFATEWIDAWNAHDLDAIVAHYAEDFRLGLEAYPDLHFELFTALPGASSIALHYRSVGGRLAIETMEVDADGLVVRAAAHYSGPQD
jgi:ketosteroid isomerase-like protein